MRSQKRLMLPSSGPRFFAWEGYVIFAMHEQWGGVSLVGAEGSMDPPSAKPKCGSLRANALRSGLTIGRTRLRCRNIRGVLVRNSIPNMRTCMPIPPVDGDTALLFFGVTPFRHLDQKSARWACNLEARVTWLEAMPVADTFSHAMLWRQMRKA